MPRGSYKGLVGSEQKRVGEKLCCQAMEDEGTGIVERNWDFRSVFGTDE
jgi:Holliday junction resolvase-like predicted endonuclease